VPCSARTTRQEPRLSAYGTKNVGSFQCDSRFTSGLLASYKRALKSNLNVGVDAFRQLIPTKATKHSRTCAVFRPWYPTSVVLSRSVNSSAKRNVKALYILVGEIREQQFRLIVYHMDFIYPKDFSYLQPTANLDMVCVPSSCI